MLRRTLLQGLPLAALTLPLASRLVLAQDAAGYPDRPVMIIVPFAAGGNTDAFARLVGEKLDGALGQRFVVDNKAGAGGNLGVGQLARASPTATRWAWARSAPTRSIPRFTKSFPTIRQPRSPRSRCS